MTMHIEPLSYKTLNRAINLTNQVFPYQRQKFFENASIAFQASLAQNNWFYKIFLYLKGIQELSSRTKVNDTVLTFVKATRSLPAG